MKQKILLLLGLLVLLGALALGSAQASMPQYGTGEFVACPVCGDVEKGYTITKSGYVVDGVSWHDFVCRACNQEKSQRCAGGRANCMSGAVCAVCKKVYTAPDPNAHSFSKYVSDQNATCTKDGTKTAKCDRCGAPDTQPDAGSALGHSFTQYQSNKDATCTKDGTKTAKCGRCDAVDTQPDVGSALGHSFTQYQSNKDATCTKDGTKTAKCDRCDATDTQPDAGSALGHDFAQYTVKTPATCTDNLVETAQCTRCEAVDTQVRSGTALGHDYKQAWWVEPTCTTDGQESDRCARCGQYDAAVVPMTVRGSALGHSFTKYVPDGNATCLKDGTKTAKCDRCSATDTQPDVGSALGHSFTKYVSDHNGTCLNDGTRTAKCDRCDATNTITEVGSALGHSFTNYVSDQNATCLEDGTQTAKCDRCDVTNTIVEQGTALGHDYTAEVIKPTCTQRGYTLYTCLRCGATDQGEETSAKGHWYGEWSPLADGMHSAKCQREGCGFVAKASCQMVEVRLNTEQGEQLIRFCSVCGQAEGGERFSLVEKARAIADQSTRGAAVIRMQSGQDPLMSVAFAQGGQMTQPKGNVRVMVPAELVEHRQLILLDTDGSETKLSYEISVDKAVFHLTFSDAKPRVLRLNSEE